MGRFAQPKTRRDQSHGRICEKPKTSRKSVLPSRKTTPALAVLHINSPESSPLTPRVDSPNSKDENFTSSALGLWNRYHELGDVRDLEEVIRIDRAALRNIPNLNEVEEYASLVGNLGVSLLDLFAKTGRREILDEAHGLLQQAVNLIPVDGPALPRAKCNLGSAFRSRFELLGDSNDLDQAIDLFEESLRDTPLDHSLRNLEQSQSMLARSLLARGSPQDIARAISLLAIKQDRKWNTSHISSNSNPVIRDENELVAVDFGMRATEVGLPVRDLTGAVTKTADFPSGFGYFADIFLGEWRDGRRSRKKVVAIKVLRRNTMDSQDMEVTQRIQNRLHSEIRLWSTLDHPNVVKMYGTCDGFGPHSSIICPWYANGTVSAFLKRHKSLVYFERLRLIREVGAGLSYLHSNAIIHGDLTGPNILIDDQQHACLSDFGLSVLARELEMPVMSQTSGSIGGAVRWAAPELYSYGKGTPCLTLYCDVYSFGSVALEIFTGNIPYQDVEHDIEVLLKYVLANVKPSKPRGIQDKHWDAIEQCWSNEVTMRPNSKVLASLFEV